MVTVVRVVEEKEYVAGDAKASFPERHFHNRQDRPTRPHILLPSRLVLPQTLYMAYRTRLKSNGSE